MTQSCSNCQYYKPNRHKTLFALTVPVFSHIDVYSYKGLFAEVNYILKLIAMLERKEQRN